MAIWAIVLLTIFVAFRSSDLLRLPTLVGNLGGGPVAGSEGFIASVTGIVVALLIGLSWFGLGSLAASFIRRSADDVPSVLLSFVSQTALGAVIWSLIWFFIGLANGYDGIFAAVAVAVGLVCAAAENASGNEITAAASVVIKVRRFMFSPVM